MTTLGDAATFANDEEAYPPLTAAIVQAAINVMSEDPTTGDHASRAGFAAQVLANPDVVVRRFAWAVSTNSTVVGSWVGGDHAGAIDSFQFVVNSVFNAEAGIATS